ncbi:MAG: replication initiation factor domain-containing protein, partial [Planctomycetota bacterium]
LLERGLPDLLRALDEIFRTIGVVVQETKVSRVDLCADVVGLEMREVFSDWLNNRGITQTRKFAIYGVRGSNGRGLDGVQTLSLGARNADCQLRIYDKVAEVAGDQWKTDLMVANRWGGLVENAARVEFQIRREKLREMGFDSLESVLQGLSHMVSVLTSEWFRVADDDVDRRHTERSSNAQWWDNVCNAFASWTQVWGSQKSVVIKREGTTAEKMMRQAIGCLQRLFAEVGSVPDSAAKVVGYVQEAIAEDYEAFVSGAAEKYHQLRGRPLGDVPF